MIYLNFFGLSFTGTADVALVFLLCIVIVLQIVSLLLRIFEKR